MPNHCNIKHYPRHFCQYTATDNIKQVHFIRGGGAVQEAIGLLEDQFWEFSRDAEQEGLEGVEDGPQASEEEASAMAWRSLQAATALRHLLRPSRRNRFQVAHI